MGSFEGPSERIGWQRFPEPHDVGTQGGAAARAGGWDLCVVLAGLDDHALSQALRAPDVAVQLYNVPATRPPVQAVHVLGDEGEGGDVPLQIRQGLVPRVRHRPLY